MAKPIRLIDADALKKEIAKRTPHFVQRIEFTPCFEAIRNAPTVDAVPIIRCKDCKEWTQTAGDDKFSVGRCSFLEHDLVMSRGYCAWGVRKDDE